MYKSKYFKYKRKYLELKKLIGSGLFNFKSIPDGNLINKKIKLNSNTIVIFNSSNNSLSDGELLLEGLHQPWHSIICHEPDLEGLVYDKVPLENEWEWRNLANRDQESLWSHLQFEQHPEEISFPVPSES